VTDGRFSARKQLLKKSATKQGNLSFKKVCATEFLDEDANRVPLCLNSKIGNKYKSWEHLLEDDVFIITTETWLRQSKRAVLFDLDSVGRSQSGGASLLLVLLRVAIAGLVVLILLLVIPVIIPVVISVVIPQLVAGLLLLALLALLPVVAGLGLLSWSLLLSHSLRVVAVTGLVVLLSDLLLLPVFTGLLLALLLPAVVSHLVVGLLLSGHVLLVLLAVMLLVLLLAELAGHLDPLGLKVLVHLVVIFLLLVFIEGLPLCGLLLLELFRLWLLHCA